MEFWKPLLERGLADDNWRWDWTTRGTLPDKPVRAKLIAKGTGVWAASGLASAAADHGVTVRMLVKDGAKLRKGDVVAEWSGSARAVLAVERPFINLAAYAGGIATQTRELVELVARAAKKVKTAPPRVTSTRKILPAYRELSLHAVIAGGGFPHRPDLASGVLIKENHIAAAGGIAKAIQGARAVAPHLYKIEIEVRDLSELDQAITAGAEVVMLDNFSPSQAKAALKRAAGRMMIEISGGITRDSIARYVLPGVHVISCGSLTHSVKAIDLSLLIT